MTSSVVPWSCTRCGSSVAPTGSAPGVVYSECRQVVCRRCLGAAALSKTPHCPACREEAVAPDVGSHSVRDLRRAAQGSNPPRGLRRFLRRHFSEPPSYGRVLQTSAMGLLGGTALGGVSGALALVCTVGRPESGWAFMAAVVGASVGSLAGPVAAWTSLLARSRKLGVALCSLLGACAGASGGAMAARLWLNGHSYGLPTAPGLPLVGAVLGVAFGLTISALVRRPEAGAKKPVEDGRNALPRIDDDSATALGRGPAEVSLARQVRSAGRVAASLRFLLPAAAALGAIALRMTELSPMGVGFWGLSTSLELAAYFGGLLPLTCLLAMGYRRLRQRQLRRRLAALPPEAQEAILAPLVDPGNPETREIAEPLLRELRARAPSEVAPAGAPDGRGAELAAGGSLEADGGTR